MFALKRSRHYLESASWFNNCPLSLSWSRRGVACYVFTQHNMQSTSNFSSSNVTDGHAYSHLGFWVHV
jgi:hypothetical protein